MCVCVFVCCIMSLSVLLQILIELETALLDDIPHWYKLQTHDVSSIPLPQPSPYLPRRHVHGDSPSKKLQSMSGYIGNFTVCIFTNTCVCDSIPVLWTYTCVWVLYAVFYPFNELSLWCLDLGSWQQNLCVCVCVVYVCLCVQGLIASLIQSLMMVWWLWQKVGWWGGMVTDHFLVLARRRPALGERAPSLHPPLICFSQTFQPPFGSTVCVSTNWTQIKVINRYFISKRQHSKALLQFIILLLNCIFWTAVLWCTAFLVLRFSRALYSSAEAAVKGFSSSAGL